MRVPWATRGCQIETRFWSIGQMAGFPDGTNGTPNIPMYSSTVSWEIEEVGQYTANR